LTEVKSGKISTREGTLLAELVPTSKIVADAARLVPTSRIVAWKYEVEGGRDRGAARRGAANVGITVPTPAWRTARLTARDLGWFKARGSAFILSMAAGLLRNWTV